MTMLRSFVAIMALLLAAGADAAIRIVDGAGNEVSLAQPARRIVSLAPHATEVLFAAELWDLTSWASRSAMLTEQLLGATPLYRAVEAMDGHAASLLAAGFTKEADALRHLQSDPLLPQPLLPAKWPAEGLRSALARHHEAFELQWRGWLRNRAPQQPTC